MFITYSLSAQFLLKVFKPEPFYCTCTKSLYIIKIFIFFYFHKQLNSQFLWNYVCDLFDYLLLQLSCWNHFFFFSGYLYIYQRYAYYADFHCFHFSSCIFFYFRTYAYYLFCPTYSSHSFQATIFLYYRIFVYLRKLDILSYTKGGHIIRIFIFNFSHPQNCRDFLYAGEQS